LTAPKAADDHYILDRAYVMAAVKHIADTASLPASEMASGGNTTPRPLDLAMQATLHRALKSALNSIAR
jgi:hypothetical protein